MHPIAGWSGHAHAAVACPVLAGAAMTELDEIRFSSFARDLARRHRRPRSYPRPPSVSADVLEQLCGGGPTPLVAPASEPDPVPETLITDRAS